MISATTALRPLETSHTFSERLFHVLETADEHVEFWVNADERRRTTYAELSADARRIAGMLHSHGYTPGEVAVLAFEPGPDFLRALLGALHAGLVVAPVPLASGRSYAEHRLEAITHDAGSRLVLCDASGQQMARSAPLGDHVAVVILPATDDDALETVDHAAWEPPTIRPEDLVILQYTSGSTGTPKGVEITQGNLQANQVACTEALGSRPGDLMAGWLPHYHDMGLIGQFLHPLAFAGSLAFTTPPQFLRRPLTWLKMLSQSRATITVAPDFAYAHCSRLLRPEQVAGLDLSALRIAVTGSEPVRQESIDAFSRLLEPTGFDPRAFLPCYGMAETTLLVSGHEPDEAHRVLHADPTALAAHRLATAPAGTGTDIVSCGRPATNTDLRIVPPGTDGHTGHDLPEGDIGEIWVRGPFVSHGYRNRPATPDDFAATLGDTGPYYRTGDLGALVDGRLYVTGRVKELLIVHGRNVYPGDVEQTVVQALGDAATGIAAVFEARDDEHPTGAVHVVVELTPTAISRPEAGLTGHVRRTAIRTLGTTAVTVHLVRRGAIPRTTSGKVRRGHTRDLLARGELTTVTLQDDPA